MAHNSTIGKVGDGYLLYYIGSPYHRWNETRDTDEMRKESYANISIRLATSESFRGPRQAFDQPILDIRPDKWDSFIVTNPAPEVCPDDQILRYYRSNTPNRLRIGLSIAETYGGPCRRVQNDPIFEFENGTYVEDLSVWCNEDNDEMLAKDMLGGLSGEVHSGVRFHSKKEINWSLKHAPKAYSRHITYEVGSSQQLASLKRPQLPFDEENRPICLFATAANVPGGFRSASHTWNIAVPIESDWSITQKRISPTKINTDPKYTSAPTIPTSGTGCF